MKQSSASKDVNMEGDESTMLTAMASEDKPRRIISWFSSYLTENKKLK
jgi:hypothetical protein